MNLDEFIASNERNAWIREPGLNYYVRKSLWFLDSIELSSCSAEGNNEFGYYRFLKRYEHVIPFTAENVLNMDLCRLLRQRHWFEYGAIPDIVSQFASPLMVEQFSDNDMFIKLILNKGERKPVNDHR